MQSRSGFKSSFKSSKGIVGPESLAHLGSCSAPAWSTLPSISLASIGRTLLYAYVEAILTASTYEGVHERARDGGGGEDGRGGNGGPRQIGVKDFVQLVPVPLL